MRFGHTLKKSIYPPWKDHYIEYTKLKRLLREHEARDDSLDASEEEASQWTEQDEEAFVQELVNVQLDKVHAFQVDTYKQLRDRTSECEARLEPLALKENVSQIEDETQRMELAQNVLKDLDAITQEVSQLEKFSRINFTGFLKAGKKHDRKRGARYKVKPLLQVRLAQLPFNTEDYSPLLYRLSTMYSFVRQNLGQRPREPSVEGPSVDMHLGQDAYNSHKFWVHMDNVLEVKTHILRRLPVLVYNPSVSSKDLNFAQKDPTITSLYFDSPKFELYNQKVAKAPGASSLRLRWTGQLNDKPEIYLEKKAMCDGDSSKEVRIRIKEKNIQSFLQGDYKMEKLVHKMEDRNAGASESAEALKKDVEEIQSFIREKELQPVLRATYTRTAFQIPGDDRVRISLDTDLAMIREDCIDMERPCRDPDNWHRTDIDNREMEFPFSEIRPGEICRFPYALLEIKVRGNDARRGSREWLVDLMTSHLVKDAPRFSKFVHGVAELFEDHVNSFPFWLSELNTDIRRDPEVAFQEEQERIAKRAKDELAVGSFLGGSHPSPPAHPVSSSPAAKVIAVESSPAESSQAADARPTSAESLPIPIPRGDRPTPEPSQPSGLLSFIPRISMSRYAAAHRQRSAPLPPGVRHPGTWIKDSGPVRVEAKVWLANQRTFIKWQHICVLLATLSLGLYNAAEAHNTIARALALVYTCFAVFAGAWGWWMYLFRSRLIRERSGRDFDNIAGPLIVCLGLAVALVLNFWFKYTATVWNADGPSPISVLNMTTSSVGDGVTLVNQAAAGQQGIYI
ncbi:Phosphate metabolism transcription protein [Onygenales sp. PD_40]|nr:Phosphate metabolism transcription protein [Onygenales sp. PD_40]